MTWAEKAAADPELRAHIAAEVARAGIDVAVLKVENEHKEQVIASLRQKLQILERERRVKKL